MLNTLPEKKDAKIELKRRDIEVALNRSETPSIVLIYPPTEELRNIRDNYIPRISLREALRQDPFSLKALYEEELERTLERETSLSDSTTFLNRVANLYDLTDRSSRAREYLERAFRLGDREFFAGELARSYIRTGNLAAATKSLDQAELGRSLDARLLRSQVALISGDIDAADQFVSAALLLDPIDVDANIARGGICLLRREPESAIRHFRVAISEGNVPSNVYVNLALCHYLLGNALHATRDLQRAVSINPTNENALVFFADLLFELHQAGGAIPTLKRYLQFEEKSEAAWNRLARSYFVLEKFSDALEALRHEANLTNKPTVWNNIAVVHDRMGEKSRAESYFNLALTLAEKSEKDRPELAFPIRANLAAHYVATNRLKEALRLTTAAIESAGDRGIDISDILPTRLDALIKSEQIDEARELCRTALSSESVRAHARLGLLTSMCAAVADGDRRDEISQIAREILSLIDDDHEMTEALTVRARNNSMFAFLQIGDLESAERVAQRLGSWVHRDPFVTATFGLLALKKSAFDRGMNLYGEAIGLARDRKLKDLIRQRQNFEVGRLYVERGDARAAHKFLKRAAEEKLGAKNVKTQATKLLRHLSELQGG